MNVGISILVDGLYFGGIAFGFLDGQMLILEYFLMVYIFVKSRFFFLDGQMLVLVYWLMADKLVKCRFLLLKGECWY